MILPPPEPDDEEKLEELSQDQATPFSPPDDVAQPATDTDDDQQADDDQPQTSIDPTHPATDTNIEVEEWYDEGLPGANEAQEPNAGDAVIAYRKPDGQAKRRTKGGDYGNNKAA